VKREGPLGVEQGVAILVQVCGALQEAHNMGIVHRDLKPENIFLCKQVGIDEFPKVLDFGLAKVTEQQMQPGSVNLTQEGMVFGTPEFMSPEQAQGKQLDPRSDIYSLSVILYEALTGKLPFDARTPMEYIQKHVVEPPIPLSQRIEGLTFPPGLDDVVAKAMAKRRADRYQSAIQFAAALRPFAGSAGTLLDNIFQMTPEPPAVGGESPAPAAPTPAPAAPAAAPVPAPSAGPSTGILLAVAAVCLVVGAALTVAILKLVGP
jgi:serine/threonine-protein kinase